VKTIEGVTKKIKISAGTQPDEKIVLSNEGFQIMNSNSKGDHILTVKITIPKSLTP